MADPIQTQPLMSQGRAVRTSPALPVHARRGAFMPEPGGFLLVTLPGEAVRATVEEIFGDDIVTVRLIGTVMAKTGHAYKTNDLIAVRRMDRELKETWEPVTDREGREQEERERAVTAARRDAAQVAAAPEPVAVAAPVAPAPDLADSASFPPRPVVAEPVRAVEPVPALAPRRVLGPRRSKIARSA
jgi:hypothetical protein